MGAFYATRGKKTKVLTTRGQWHPTPLTVNRNNCSESGISESDGTIAGESPPNNESQRAVSTWPTIDRPLNRLLGQLGHTSRRDPNRG